MNLWRAARKRADLFIAAFLGAASFGLYLKTLAPTLLMGDGAEFQFACYLAGIAHPTGYPLYLILGWLWSHLLPLGDVAYRINLLSAFFAALAIGLVYPLSLNILKMTLGSLPRPLLRAAAVIATLSLALSRTFWSQAVRAEVYALNSLFVVATLYLLILWSRQEPCSPRTLQAAALVYGLSLTHHRTMILFLPAYLLFVWLTDRSALTGLKSLGRLLLLMLAPQLLYLHIPWRAPATPYLHIYLGPGRELELYDNTLRGFLGFVVGSIFRGELGYQAPLPLRLIMTGSFLATQFGRVGVLLGLVGMVRLGIGRWKVLVLVGLFYLGVVIFCLFYFIGDIGVLYTPSYIVFAIWMALGMGWIVEGALVCSVRTSTWLSASFGASEWLTLRLCSGQEPSLGARLARSVRFTAHVLVFLFALIPLSLLWDNHHRVDISDYHRARDMSEEILAQPMPEGAILVSNDRNEITPLIYLQYVEGVRPDLVGLFPLILPGEEYANVVRVIDSVIDVERPLFMIKEMDGLEIKYRMELIRPLVHVLSPAISHEPHNPTNLTLNDSLSLIGYDQQPLSLSPGEQLRVALYWHVNEALGEDYHSYVHLVDERGNIIAQSDHRPGGDYYPTSLWQPAETLLDEHAPAVPAETAPGTYRLLAGMYLFPSMEPLGEALTLGKVGISF